MGLFNELGIESEKSDMSFGLSTDDVEWGSLGLSGIFAQKSNMVRLCLCWVGTKRKKEKKKKKKKRNKEKTIFASPSARGRVCVRHVNGSRRTSRCVFIFNVAVLMRRLGIYVFFCFLYLEASPAFLNMIREVIKFGKKAPEAGSLTASFIRST